MAEFIIIETDDGLTIAALEPGTSPETVAERQGGVLVDTNVYTSFDDASDALLTLQSDEEEVEDFPA
jgi:hypothetical protein